MPSYYNEQEKIKNITYLGYEPIWSEFRELRVIPGEFKIDITNMTILKLNMDYRDEEELAKLKEYRKDFGEECRIIHDHYYNSTLFPEISNHIRAKP